MFNKIAVYLSNPKFRKISGPNVVMPPEGTEMEKMRQNQHHVLISRSASVTCDHFHSLETTPMLFSARRSMASTFSSSLKKRASIGESGTRKLRIYQ